MRSLPARSILWLLPIAVCVASGFACAAGGDPADGDAGSDDSGSTTATPAGSGGSGGNDVGLGAAASSGSGGLAACVTSSEEATLVPVNMFISFDRSGSMGGNGKWGSATAALKSFVSDPASAGLRVALRWFPKGDCDDDACSATACSTPNVPLGALSKDPAPADTQELSMVTTIDATDITDGGGTPISAALAGATKWAKAHVAANPTEKAVVVILTDGAPNGCNEDIDDIADLAHDAQATAGVLTYAVGLEGSNESDMDAIAQAGGTQNGFFIGSGNAQAELLAALKEIQGSQVACEFAVPASDGNGQAVDPAEVNVDYTPGGGGPATTFGQVAAVADCGPSGGWYYDDPAAPTTITLCPDTCASVQADQGAKIEILFGCATQPAS